MSGDLPDIITVDGPNVSAYVANNIIQPLEGVSEKRQICIFRFYNRTRNS